MLQGVPHHEAAEAMVQCAWCGFSVESRGWMHGMRSLSAGGALEWKIVCLILLGRGLTYNIVSRKKTLD